MRVAPLTLVVIAAVNLPSPQPLRAQRAQLTQSLEDLRLRAVRDSNDPTAHYELALGLLVKKKYDEAEEALHQAIQVEPEFAEGYLALSYVPFARDKNLWKEQAKEEPNPKHLATLSDAWRLRAKAFTIDPLADLSVIGAVLPPREALGLTKRQLRAYKQIMKGFEYFWGSQYVGAYDWFDGLINWFESESDSVPAWAYWYRGLAAAQVMKYQEALSDFNVLLDHAEQADQSEERFIELPFAEANQYRYLLGVINQLAGHRKEAIAGFQEVLEYDLGFYQAHVRLADLYEERKRYRPAMTERQRAVALDSDNPTLQYQLGLTYARLGFWQDAIATLEHALEMNPRSLRTAFLLADINAEISEEERAADAFRYFLSIAPQGSFGAERRRAESYLASHGSDGSK